MKGFTCLPQLSAPVVGGTHSSYLDLLRRSSDPLSCAGLSHDASFDSIGHFDSKPSQFSGLRFIHLILNSATYITFVLAHIQ
jgi:hypothetical protein